MFSGTAQDRRDLFAEYIAKKIDLPYGSESLVQKFIKGEDISGTDLASVVENFLREKTGVNFAPGTIEALIKGDVAELTDINKGLISKYADDLLGLPSGTTHLVWDSYIAYQNAASTYSTVWQGGDPSKIAEAKQAFRDIKANIIASVVTFVFAKQLSKLDQKLGLPSGTSSALVSALILWFTPASLIALGYALLFGVYKVSILATACNYWPYNGTDPSGAPDWMKMKNPDKEDQLGILPPEFPACPGVWDAKKAENFQGNAIDAAQYKVAMLIGDLLYMGKNLEKQGEEIAADDNMYPIQILTLRGEDRARYSNLIASHYGTLAAERGWTGVIVSEKVWDHVHVGY